jgi:TolA-binding protein
MQSPTSDAAAQRGRTPSDADSRRQQVSWQQLNREGQFSRVLEEANTPGLSRTLSTRPASDLLALGDASRLVKDWETSRQAYLAARRRFPQTESAALASYSLGRMAFDNQKNYAAAAQWLETYLKENSRGALAREALGRLMEARDRLGNPVGAKSAAVEYLSRYPQGPHAALAQSLVNRP